MPPRVRLQESASRGAGHPGMRQKEQSMIPNPVTTNFRSQALTDAELRLEAPSIFATAPMSGLSQRYTFVPTTEIVAGLREKHWLPVHVEQQRVRLESRFGFRRRQTFSRQRTRIYTFMCSV